MQQRLGPLHAGTTCAHCGWPPPASLRQPPARLTARVTRPCRRHGAALPFLLRPAASWHTFTVSVLCYGISEHVHVRYYTPPPLNTPATTLCGTVGSIRRTYAPSCTWIIENMLLCCRIWCANGGCCQAARGRGQAAPSNGQRATRQQWPRPTMYTHCNRLQLVVSFGVPGCGGAPCH